MADALHLDADHLRSFCEIALAGQPVLIRVFEYDARGTSGAAHGAPVAGDLTSESDPTHVALLFHRGALALVGTGQSWTEAAEDVRQQLRECPGLRTEPLREERSRQALPQFRPGRARA